MAEVLIDTAVEASSRWYVAGANFNDEVRYATTLERVAASGRQPASATASNANVSEDRPGSCTAEPRHLCAVARLTGEAEIYRRPHGSGD